MSIRVKVCMGTHCTMMGSLNLQESLENLQINYPEEIIIEPIKCLNFCNDDKAPVVEVDGKIITNASSGGIISEILKLIDK